MTLPTAVIHPRHPRGVAEALDSVSGIRLVQPDSHGLMNALGKAEIFVTFMWDESFLVDSLRWIQSISAGVDQYPIEELAGRDVVLTSASGLHAIPVAEHAFALLLALTRGVGVSTRDTLSKVWKPRMAEEISGRTMTVLGLGAIGEEIARRARMWGMTVFGVKRDPVSHRGNADSVIGLDGLVDAVSGSDILISVLPGGPDTDGVIDRRVLGALGGGWFVNVGRGNVVSEEDLLWALDHGLAGAGLDVFDEEPLPETSPLWEHPRVVITPHIAGLSPGYGPRLAEILEFNLEAFHGRGEWRNRIV